MKTFDLKAWRNKLADHYKRTCEVPRSVWSLLFNGKLEKMYTPLSFVQIERTTGPPKAKRKDYGEMFTADDDGIVPKRILVQGETGIGKSTFVKRLTMDWAQLCDQDIVDEQRATPNEYPGGKKPLLQGQMDVSQVDSSETRKLDDSSDSYIDALKKFQLVITVPLKDLSNCQTFREVLIRSPLIPTDEEYLADDLLSYVLNSKEKVLLLLDGFDEYCTAEGKNNLICEIFLRNQLRDCTVLVTTRSSVALELLKSAGVKHFEITGFDFEEQMIFMTKVLSDSSRVFDLHCLLVEGGVHDLLRVPILNLFFCLLFEDENEKFVALIKRKSELYRAIMRCILQFSHRRHSSPIASKVIKENYKEILAEVGKVALESLLKGSQVFEYGQLSEKVRGEESVMLGLLQLSEYGASSGEPMKMVSFVHKSIQEYLAAWFIANRCVPEGNLGGIEKQPSTLRDFLSMENVFKFVCSLSKDGAVKVLKYLSTIRDNDPSLDFSKLIPAEKDEKYDPPCEITERHEMFNDLVFSCFQEASSQPELVEHLFDCTGGIILLHRSLGPEILPKPDVLTGKVHSWAFFAPREFKLPSGPQFRILLFGEDDQHHKDERPIKWLYESVNYLEFLRIPVRLVGSSGVIRLGDFLAKFLDIACKGCSFQSILCFREGKMNCYISDVRLTCNCHTREFTKALATISGQSLSAYSCSSESCLPCLSCLRYLDCSFVKNGELLRDLGATIRNCKHLRRIFCWGNYDYTPTCELVKQLSSPGALSLIISIESASPSVKIYKMTVEPTTLCLDLFPRFQNDFFLELCLSSISSETAMAIISSITPNTLRELTLNKIIVTSSVAVVLGQALPTMTALQTLQLTGAGSTLHPDDMEILFKGFNQMLCLEKLRFRSFHVTGSLAPLTNKFRFFAHLKELTLWQVSTDGDCLCLLESFQFIPKLQKLHLLCDSLGDVDIGPHLAKLTELIDLYVSNFTRH